MTIPTLPKLSARLASAVLFLAASLPAQVIQVSEAEPATEAASFSRILSLIAMLLLAQAAVILAIILICRLARGLNRNRQPAASSPYTIPAAELEAARQANDKEEHATADHR